MAIQSNSLEWEECRMKATCMSAPTAWLRLLALTLSALLGFASHAGAIAAIQCGDHQPYKLKIFNDSKVFNIYAVIATPTNDADEWLQGAAQILDSQKATLTYGHKFVYRIYINPTVGIAPHGSVTLTLPLCSQLAADPDPTKPDQYINWWNGGRVYLYGNLKSLGEPPPELVADFTKDQANPVSPKTPGPSCDGCKGVPNPPTIYKSATSLPANDPAQLTEYTLTGLDKGDKAKNPDPTWKLIPKIVDYDISYVDHVYLPAAMGPVDNPDIGYIGSIQDVGVFKQIMDSFLLNYAGWPRYLHPLSQTPYLRIPGTYNAFAQYNPMETTIITKPGAAITELGDLWTSCITSPGSNQICHKIRTVNDFFLKNYDNYRQLIIDGQCKPPGGIPPADPPLKDLLKKVYGWVPWNEDCTGGAATNDLARDPDFQKVHKTYIALQYSKPLGTFNPYVNLVHGTDYLDMPGSYAFSVDDDVGNMLVDGTGIIITVGGSAGLDNDVQYDKSKLVNVNLGDPEPLKDRPLWSQYGFCKGMPVRDINKGVLNLQITSVRFPCVFGMTDQDGRTYTFTLASPPYPSEFSRTPITDCTAPSKQWCDDLKAKTETSPALVNYVQASAPPPR
jgi:hypothetical protein